MAVAVAIVMKKRVSNNFKNWITVQARGKRRGN
jgi:hypothetical protein